MAPYITSLKLLNLINEKVKAVFLFFILLSTGLGLWIYAKMEYLPLMQEEIIPYVLIQLLTVFSFFFFLIFIVPLTLSKLRNRKTDRKVKSIPGLLFNLFWSSLLVTFSIHFFLVGYSSIADLFVYGLLSGFYSCLFYVLIMMVPLGTITKDTLHIADDPNDQIKFLLTGRSSGDQLQVCYDNLFYIQACENYCEIFYYENKKLFKKMFRVSLKELESQLKEYPFMRVHKSYIINLNYVTKIVGNVNNTKAILKNLDYSIPIARSRREEVLKIYNLLESA